MGTPLEKCGVAQREAAFSSVLIRSLPAFKADRNGVGCYGRPGREHHLGDSVLCLMLQICRLALNWALWPVSLLELLHFQEDPKLHLETTKD